MPSAAGGLGQDLEYSDICLLGGAGRQGTAPSGLLPPLMASVLTAATTRPGTAATSVPGRVMQRGYCAVASPPCRASWSSCSSCLDSEVFSTVPPYWLIASTALSGVTFSSIRNSAELPGLIMSLT